MTDFGSIGRLRSNSYSTLLNVWSGTSVACRINPSYRVSYQAPNLTPKISTLLPPYLFSSVVDNDGINYKIVEVTKRFGVPQAMKVRLYDRETGQLLAEKMSAANGVVEFNYLDSTKYYTLIALDGESTYNASVLDLKRPEI